MGVEWERWGRGGGVWRQSHSVAQKLPPVEGACPRWGVTERSEAAAAGEQVAPGLGQGVEEQQHAAQQQRVLLEGVSLLEELRGEGKKLPGSGIREPEVRTMLCCLAHLNSLSGLRRDMQASPLGGWRDRACRLAKPPPEPGMRTFIGSLGLGCWYESSSSMDVSVSSTCAVQQCSTTVAT